jgi:hypothetical protein
MQPRLWQPPLALAPTETAIVQRIKRAKLFVFLRAQRHVLFSAAFQQELGQLLYADHPQGQPPIPPAQLALATILQAYMRLSDDEVIEATLMDRRWQLVLDCLDAEAPPFSKGTLVAFRQRLIMVHGDRRLLERTVEVATATTGFSPKALRAALDSSPLWGAGRVEDTYNLLGHALRKALDIIADQQGRGLAAVAQEAGAALVDGTTSLKAALDGDWDDPDQRRAALGAVLTALTQVEHWMQAQPDVDPGATAALAIAQQVRDQDVVSDDAGHPTLRQGTAKARRISVEDGAMRHGRKSKSKRIDGYKRHVLTDLDTGLVPAVGVTPANQPEAMVTAAIQADLAHQAVTVVELAIDRAYLSSTWVRERPPNLQIVCKAWPVRPGPRFSKPAFTLDWEREQVTCPNGVVVPLRLDAVLHFPPEQCAACPLRARCTTSLHGRSLSIHPDERLLVELRQAQQTLEGRARLRERVVVEHTLAHVGYWQRPRARYLGQRKNVFDLRRSAMIQNLHIFARALAA